LSTDILATTGHDHDEEEFHDDIIYPSAIGFALVHLACFGILWSGVTTKALVLCVALYLVRMFAVTGGYHRYFSHRSYKTSRVAQFLLAVLCQTTAQKGVLWWAAKHRHHHRHSDLPSDVHSPRHHGFLFSHLGWIFAKQRGEADYSLVGDFTQYPELVWLNRFQNLPALLLAVGCWAYAGLPGLFVGFFLSTVLLYHGTFMINSLAHVVGKQRYVTGDDSRNNWFLALITLGEGWHNNHHYYQSATRQGFRWWEIDITFYVLKVLSWLGIVWDLRSPPPEVVRNEQRLGRRTVEKVARQLAASFSIETISEQIRAAWHETPGLEDLSERMKQARSQAASVLADVHLPQIPTLEELTERARQMFAHTPSLDEVVARAHEILLASVSARLLGDSELAPTSA
jgi:stearoyl-CoA desaturase (delta-9 desaturase)